MSLDIFLFWLDSERILIDGWLWYLEKIVMATAGSGEEQLVFKNPLFCHGSCRVG